jgi:prevent-host-death family protein
VKQINVYEAKTHLSRLLEQANQGESFTIAKSGTPLARLVPLDEAEPAKIQFGLMKGRIEFADDFDEPLPDEVLAGFEGDSAQ